MRLRDYSNFMAIKLNSKRISLFASIIIMCVSTAMHCRKADYIYRPLEGLEGKKVWLELKPQQAVYKVGDTVLFEIQVKAADLGLQDFRLLDYISVSLFDLFDKNNDLKLDYDACKRGLVIANLSSDKLTYTQNDSIILQKAGKFRISRPIYTYLKQPTKGLLSITIFSGKRVPRGYIGQVPIYFKESQQPYIDIEVQ